MPTSPSSLLFWLCLAVLLWPVLWLSILLHEAGHVIAGRLGGYYVGAWGLGTGEPFLLLPPRSRPAHTRFFLCRREPFNGFTGTVFPGLFPTRRQAATLLTGGIAMNLFLCFVGVALTRVSLPVGLIIAGVNGLLFLMAGVPRRGGLPSDGARLLALLGPRGTRVPAVSPRAALGHRALWQAVQAPVLAQVSTLAAAASAADLGDLETADRYLCQATETSNLPLPSPALNAYAALAQGLRDEVAGGGEAARTHFTSAQDTYEAQGCRAAAHLARLYAAGQDIAQLNTLSGDALTQCFPALRYLVTGRVLAAVCAEAPTSPDRLATALSRFQNARLSWREDTRDAHLLALAAHALTRSGDTAGASLLWEQARVARARVEIALADEPHVLAAYRRHMAQDAPSAVWGQAG